MNTPTPHIEAKKEDISPLVIMPGDPNRCKYIADNFLDNVRLINEVRGELGFTGYYKGVKVTVFSSGMGIPSMGIYSYELFNFYDVKAIIRIGSSGSYVKELNVKDLFLVDSSYTESNYAMSTEKAIEKLVYSSKELNEIIEKTAMENNINLKKGRCYSTESFYTESFNMDCIVNEHDCKCVEMESFALFLNARSAGKKAACLLTISDSFVTKEVLSSKEREVSFNEMITLALDSIIRF